MTKDAKATKGVCKDHCELVFKKVAEKAHAGFKVEQQVPCVGTLHISIGIVAVIFNQDLITATYGKTAIDYKKRYNSALPRNNLMNEKILEDQSRPHYLKKYGAGFNDLKRKLDEDYDSNKENLSIQELMSEINHSILAKNQKAAGGAHEAKQNKPVFYNSMSVRSLRSHKSKASRCASSVVDSALSALPELEPVILMNIAWEVFQLRSRLVNTAHDNKIGLREMLNSTKL